MRKWVEVVLAALASANVCTRNSQQGRASTYEQLAPTLSQLVVGDDGIEASIDLMKRHTKVTKVVTDPEFR